MRVGQLPAAAAAALVLAAAPAATRAEGSLLDIFTLRNLTRLSTQYVLLMMRTMVGLTYEHLAVDPRTNDVVITGLKLYPALDWDHEGACAITVERIANADDTSFDRLQGRTEVTGIAIAPSCFEPELGAMMTAFGYEGVAIESLSIETSYEFASSAASVTLHAAVRDAADVTLNAAFDYAWISGLEPDADDPGGNMRPVALLSEAELALENRGLYERLEPMLSDQLGDIQAVPQSVEAMLMQGLTEGGTRAPTAAEAAFVENVAGELARFIAEKNRIVLSAAPPGGAWLDEATLANPGALIAALQPSVSVAPLISRSLVSVSELAAAIGGEADALDEAAQLRVGKALLTGLGAPRSVPHGRALLEPMAEAWHPGAALLLAESLAGEGEAEPAYRMALRAAAGGETDALTVLDQVEEALGADAILNLQLEAAAGWPGADAYVAAATALIESADIGAMRGRAHDAALGHESPRNYADAYYWASLAAAAGDRSSAGLRQRLDRRFADAEGAARDAWTTLSQAAAAKAIETWTADGLGARVAELYGVAQ